MRKEIARDLVPLVNNVDLYPRLQAYIKAEMERVEQALTTASSWDNVNRLQGSYHILHVMSQLKERVEQDK